MKINLKQIWVLVAMLLATLSVSAADFEVDGICYDITSIENRECEVAAKEGGYEGTVEIPSKVTYSGQELTVVQIGYGAFENCSQLNKITLDEGIQSIGQDAFSGCSSLTQMIFPEGIESIGSWAFYECSSLTEIKLPNSLKEIGSAAFRGCSSIIEITIPDNVTTIGDDAFRSCSSLKSLVIGGSVESIGDNICQSCQSLQELTFLSMDVYRYLSFEHTPISSLKKLYLYRSVDGYFGEITPNLEELYCDYSGWVRNRNFTGCNKIETVTLKNVTEIGDNAFANCSNIVTLSLPETLGSIGERAFSECDKIKTLNLPNSVTTIGRLAFSGCNGLKNVTISANVRYLYNVFYLCDSIENINLMAPVPIEYEGAFLNKVYLNANLCVPVGSKEAYSSTLPWSNFFNISEKEDLVVQFIYNGVWYERADLNSNSCYAIRSRDTTEYAGNIEIPDTVICRGKKLRVTAIDSNAFYRCKYLLSVNIGKCDEIGSSAFYDCDSLRTVNIASCDEIGEQAFYDCDSLRTVNIVSCDEIGEQAFFGCESLRTANITSCNKIGASAFYSCYDLESISIPGNCIFIGNDAFNNCYSLKTVTFEDGKEPLVLGCDSWAHVGSSVTPFPNPTTVDESRTGFRNGYYDGLFYDAQRIETLIINRNIKLNQYYGREIGSTSGSSYSTVYNDMIYYSPFYGLKNLKKVVIGENVTQICENTIQAVVSAQETTMEYKNFGECDNISIVISEAPVAPIGGGFSDDVYANANLYLTNGGEDSYRNDEYWKRFVNISDLIQATAIEIVPSQLKIDCNDTYQLSCSILPEDVSLKTLQWQSSDENIATVDENGLVTSYGNLGTVEITATTCDGSDISASCIVTVADKSGIGSIDAEGNVDVRTANGNIYIINKPTGENCYVYNIGGTLVSVTINDTIYSLEKGVYVVRIGTFVKKVIL